MLNLEQMQQSAGGQMPMPGDQESMRNSLLQMVNKVKGKVQEAQLTKSGLDVKNKEHQEEDMKMFFEFLQKNGIDPSDQQAVTQFLEQMKIKQPELYASIEQFLEQTFANVAGDTAQTTEASEGIDPNAIASSIVPSGPIDPSMIAPMGDSGEAPIQAGQPQAPVF